MAATSERDIALTSTAAAAEVETVAVEFDPSNMDWKFTSSSHYNRTLLYTIEEKQLYRKKRNPTTRLATSTRYDCVVSRCKAAVYKDGERVFKQKKAHPHIAHPNGSLTAVKYEFEQFVKEQCVKSKLCPAKAFGVAIEKLSDQYGRHSDPNRMASNLRKLRQRLSKNPPVKSIIETSVEARKN